SSSSSLFLKTTAIVPAPQARTTPRNTHARHQSRVPAGRNNNAPKITTGEITPPINLRRSMFASLRERPIAVRTLALRPPAESQRKGKLPAQVRDDEGSLNKTNPFVEGVRRCRRTCWPDGHDDNCRGRYHSRR